MARLVGAHVAAEDNQGEPGVDLKREDSGPAQASLRMTKHFR